MSPMISHPQSISFLDVGRLCRSRSILTDSGGHKLVAFDSSEEGSPNVSPASPCSPHVPSPLDASVPHTSELHAGPAGIPPRLACACAYPARGALRQALAVPPGLVVSGRRGRRSGTRKSCTRSTRRRKTCRRRRRRRRRLQQQRSPAAASTARAAGVVSRDNKGLLNNFHQRERVYAECANAGREGGANARDDADGK